MSEKFFLKTGDGDCLACLTDRDENLSKQKLVVICSGFGSHKDSERQKGLVRFFSSLGYAVFRFDYFGCGESSGHLPMTTITKGLNSLKAVMEYLKGQPWVDKKHIGLYGNSYGGVLAVLEASLHPQYKFLILTSPANYLDNIDVDIEEWRKNEIMTVIRQPRHISFYDDALKYDVFKSAEKVCSPVLILHGTEDDVIPFNQSVKLNNHFSNSTLIAVEDEKHKYKNFDKFETAMKNWLINVEKEEEQNV